MIRKFATNHKVLTACAGAACGGSLLLLDKDNRVKFQDSMGQVSRTCYFLGNMSLLVFDYWYSFRKLENGTPEYQAMEHTVNQRNADRLFKVCDHLGGYFAKFGQIASTMEQSIPPEYTKTLAKCQDNLSSVPFSVFERVIHEDFHAKPEDIFLRVDDTPVGCASLAQVHRGVLRNGEEVAIKVQYPTVAKDTQVDLRNIELVTKICGKVFTNFQYDWIVPKVRETVENEFNFMKEVDNMEECRNDFLSNPSIYVPKAYREYCSSRMIVMEYIEGVKANDVEKLRSQGINPHDVGMLCIQAFGEMIFKHNYVHMDPHAGNLLVRTIPGTDKPQLVILDHGMYYHFRPGMNEQLKNLWLAMIQQDEEATRECCKPWNMEEYADVLSLAMTGRTGKMNRKMGEELSKEEMEKVRDEMLKRMRQQDREAIEKRMKKMQTMMKNMPTEMMAVFRSQMMLMNLMRTLGCKQYERLDEMTSLAVESSYEDSTGRIDYFQMFKLKWHLFLLRFKQFFNDLFVDWYYRWYLGSSKLQLPSFMAFSVY